MINYSIKDNVRWIVDPGPFHQYKEELIYQFIEWMENWNQPFIPSHRYITLKNGHIHFWSTQKFYFGLTSEEAATEFKNKWGGWKKHGHIKHSHFVLDDKIS